MVPLNHISKKYTGSSKFDKSKVTINQLLFMDDFTLFAKDEKELGTLIQAIRIYN